MRFTIVVSLITSNSPLEENTLNIFPNPAHTALTLDNNFADTKSASIIIRSTPGEIVFQKTLLWKRSEELDISGWAKGVYLVEVQTANGITQTKILKY
jgi:hypothetical protein